MSDVRHRPKYHPAQNHLRGEGKSDTLSPEMLEAIRAFMRQEWRRLRRDELYALRRGWKAELSDLDKTLGLTKE